MGNKYIKKEGIFMKLKFDAKSTALFVGGVLFGTAGVKLLSSKDAKNAYVHMTAAALRAKDCVMDTVTKVQENAEDILAEAKQKNAEREQEEACEEGTDKEAESCPEEA